MEADRYGNQRLQAYTLIKLLGKGAFGEVRTVQ